MKTKIINISTLLFLILSVSLMSGCGKAVPEGGFFKSFDGGTTFVQEFSKSGVSLIGKNILSMEVNPNNHQEIFVGTKNSGLYKSPDEGFTWLKDVNNFQSIYDLQLIPGTEVIYMAAKKDGRGKLFKSDINGESWVEVYTEKDDNSHITSIDFHASSPGTIYITNSRGGLFKTEDGGATWKNIYWTSNSGSALRVALDKVSPRIVYLGTSSQGLVISRDGGNSFEESKEIGGYIYNVVTDPAREGVVYVSTKEGLQKSLNKGVTWEVVNTLVRPDEVISRGLAINPGNHKEVYYSSGKTFYKSNNEGDTWTTVQFNMNSAIETIRVSPHDGQKIYLGTLKRSSGIQLVPGSNS